MSPSVNVSSVQCSAEFSFNVLDGSDSCFPLSVNIFVCFQSGMLDSVCVKAP